MLKKHSSDPHFTINSANNTQSFSSLPQHQAIVFNLKDLQLRKSFFFPPPTLTASYTARHHITTATVPLIQVLHANQRWLLVQTPKFSRNFFKKLNQNKLGNPYDHLIHIFKGFVTLTTLYGYFRPTSGMVTLEKKVSRVWVNQDIFSNQPQMPLRNGESGEKEFVVAFLAMVESEMLEWQRAINVCSIEQTLKLLEWRSRITRGSYTAVNASKHVIHVSSEPRNSIITAELSPMLRGQSMQKTDYRSQTDFFHQDLSSSIIIHVQEKRQVPRKIDKLLSDSKVDLKSSLYNETRNPQPTHEVRTTKKKFNLTATSSTLDKINEKLGSTIGRNRNRIQKREMGLEEQLKETVEQRERGQVKEEMEKSEPGCIANELDGLFEEDKVGELKLGVEGNREQLQKIAEEMQQVLIW